MREHPVIRILLIEDSADWADRFRERIASIPDACFEVEHAALLASALEQLREGTTDLVLVD